MFNSLVFFSKEILVCLPQTESTKTKQDSSKTNHRDRGLMLSDSDTTLAVVLVHCYSIFDTSLSTDVSETPEHMNLCLSDSF